MNSTYKSCRAEEDFHRLIHLGRTAKMWNQVFWSHKEQTPGCIEFLTWDLATEKRRGLTTRMGLRSPLCPFTSDRHNLFTEVATNTPGRKLATLNRSHRSGWVRYPLVMMKWGKSSFPQTPLLLPVSPCKRLQDKRRYQSLICCNFLSNFLSLKYWVQSCEWCNKNSLTVDFLSYI